jgi:hypothetical protein
VKGVVMVSEEENEVVRVLTDILEELKWQSRVLEKLLDQRAITMNRNQTSMSDQAFESLPSSSEDEEANPEPGPAPNQERPIQPSFSFDRDEEEDRF